MDARRLAVTSVVRHAKPNEASSFLRVIDIAEERVLTKTVLPDSPHRSDDPNPRGGLRGARGVSATGDRMVVAASDRLFVLDSDWTLIRQVTHPWMGGIHGVLAEADTIWVASTAADLLLRFDWHGELLECWSWRDDHALAETLGLTGVARFDRSRDYRVPSAGAAAEDLVHLNGVSRTGDSLVLSFGQVLTPSSARRELTKSRVARTLTRFPIVGYGFGATRRKRGALRDAHPVPAPTKRGSYAVIELPVSQGLHSARGRVVHRTHKTRVPNHDASVYGGRLIYCDSNRSKVVSRDILTGVSLSEIDIPGAPPFARGLAQLTTELFVVGSQEPASLHVVNLHLGTHVGTIDLDGLSGETVFGIAVVPTTFATPSSWQPMFETNPGQAAKVMTKHE